MKTKWSFVLIAVAALAVAIPLVLYFGGTSTTDPEPVEEHPGVSFASFMQANGAAALKRSGFARTTVTVHSFEPWRSPDDAAKPAPGNAYFALDISLWNNTGLFYNLDPVGQFFVVTADGDAYWPSEVGPTPRLPKRKMEDGAKTRGFVCFELPEDESATHFVWGYQKYPLGEELEAAK